MCNKYCIEIKKKRKKTAFIFNIHLVSSHQIHDSRPTRVQVSTPLPMPYDMVGMGTCIVHQRLSSLAKIDGNID